MNIKGFNLNYKLGNSKLNLEDENLMSGKTQTKSYDSIEDMLADNLPNGTIAVVPSKLTQSKTLYEIGAINKVVNTVAQEDVDVNNLYYNDYISGEPHLDPYFYDLLAGDGVLIFEFVNIPGLPDGTTLKLFSSKTEDAEGKVLYVSIDNDDENLHLVATLYDFDEDLWGDYVVIYLLLPLAYSSNTQWFTDLINYAKAHINEIEIDPEDTRTKEEIYNDAIESFANTFKVLVSSESVYIRTNDEWQELQSTLIVTATDHYNYSVSGSTLSNISFEIHDVDEATLNYAIESGRNIIVKIPSSVIDSVVNDNNFTTTWFDNFVNDDIYLEKVGGIKYISDNNLQGAMVMLPIYANLNLSFLIGGLYYQSGDYALLYGVELIDITGIIDEKLGDIESVLSQI